MKTKIVVLVSGGGTNLQALIDAQGTVLNSGEITLVVSNARGAYALERAKKAGIATETVIKKECGGQEGFETRLMEILDANGIEVIILAGFMTILTERFTSHYPKRILNVPPREPSGRRNLRRRKKESGQDAHSESACDSGR